MGVMDQIMGDTGEVLPSNTELSEISLLAERQLSFERAIVTAEQDLAVLKEKLREVQENLLPEAMINCGMTEFKLENGMKIKIKEDTHPSIRKDFLPQAISWLDKNGLGGIVKDDVSVKFGRGEQANVHQLMLFCESKGYNVEEKMSVHPSTLKATVKEHMSRGVQFPDEFFSIYSSRKAEIKIK